MIFVIFPVFCDKNALLLFTAFLNTLACIYTPHRNQVSRNSLRGPLSWLGIGKRPGLRGPCGQAPGLAPRPGDESHRCPLPGAASLSGCGAEPRRRLRTVGTVRTMVPPSLGSNEHWLGTQCSDAGLATPPHGCSLT